MAWSMMLPVLTLLGIGIGFGGSSLLNRQKRSVQRLAHQQWLEPRSQAYAEIIGELWKMLLLDDRALSAEGPRGLGHHSVALLAST